MQRADPEPGHVRVPGVSVGDVGVHRITRHREPESTASPAPARSAARRPCPPFNRSHARVGRVRRRRPASARAHRSSAPRPSCASSGPGSAGPRRRRRRRRCGAGTRAGELEGPSWLQDNRPAPSGPATSARELSSGAGAGGGSSAPRSSSQRSSLRATVRTSMPSSLAASVLFAAGGGQRRVEQPAARPRRAAACRCAPTPRPRAAGGGAGDLGRQVVDVHLGAARQHHAALDDVFQLAHVCPATRRPPGA